MTIAITGATGQLGRLVVDRLKTKLPRGEIVGLVRSPDKAANLDIPTRVFDYSKPEILLTALTGVDTLLLVSSSEVGHRATQHRNVIEAAKAAGVTRIVYTSLLHADVSPLNLADEHRATEADLKASGLSYTILRNGWYTENYTSSVGPALANGAFVGSAGEGRISSAPRGDYADAAVAVLTTQGHDGQVYELAGDEPYTLADLAAEISSQSGKDIPYKNLPEADYAGLLIKVGLPEWLAKGLASWDVGAAEGALFDDSRQLSKLLGHPTSPLSDAVAAAIKTYFEVRKP